MLVARYCFLYSRPKKYLTEYLNRKNNTTWYQCVTFSHCPCSDRWQYFLTTSCENLCRLFLRSCHFIQLYCVSDGSSKLYCVSIHPYPAKTIRYGIANNAMRKNYTLQQLIVSLILSPFFVIPLLVKGCCQRKWQQVTGTQNEILLTIEEHRQ